MTFNVPSKTQSPKYGAVTRGQPLPVEERTWVPDLGLSEVPHPWPLGLHRALTFAVFCQPCSGDLIYPALCQYLQKGHF